MATGHGKPRTYTIGANALNTARDLAIEAAAVLEEAVSKHDPKERALLEELHQLHLKHAEAHRFEATVHQRMAERIGSLLRADDTENRRNADALTSVRIMAGLLEPTNEPAACCA